MLLLLSALLNPAHAGDFMDVWVTTAFEDDNVRAGPSDRSPAPNFVTRGNQSFFENYEGRTTDDITRANLVLYRADEGYKDGWSTEAAFVLRYTPYLNPDKSKEGVAIEDDGSYVRIIRALPGDDHTLSLTGYAVDASRFRLGYSYDLTWGGKDIHSFTTGAAPGARLQWQKGGNYLFMGAKSAVGDYVDPETYEINNQAYYGLMAGGGLLLADRFKIEAGAGSFQQGQIRNSKTAGSELYGSLITAAGVAGQVAFRTTTELKFIQSADLKLYRNSPEFIRDTYVSHRTVDGFGALVQAEANYLTHNLLASAEADSTVIEKALAGDVQTVLVYNNTSLALDLVYKDLSYILFDIPGLTSGVAIPDDMETRGETYARAQVSHFFENAHVAPSLGLGLKQPAYYKTAEGIFVQYSERDKEAVPDGQEPAAILAAVGAVQVDMSKSVVGVIEGLYEMDNNLSEFVETDDGGGERVASAEEVRQKIGFNVMLRARF